jgi:hypothetical protein
LDISFNYLDFGYNLYKRCQLLEALVKLFELPEDDSTPDDEHYIEIEDTPGKF